MSRLQTSEVCCGGLTLEQFETLRAVEVAGDPSMSKLSATLGVNLSTMRRNVSVLQREGYVSRARHAEDSRVVTVVLTRKGANALETLRCDEKDVMARLYAKLPAANRASALQVLEMLQAVLDDGMGTESEACCSEPPAKRAVTR